MARDPCIRLLCIWDFLLALPRWAACLVGEGNQQVLWPDSCTRWPGQPSIIDSVTNAVNVRRLCASILVSRMHRCFPQSVASTGWIRSLRSTSSSKTRPNALDISSLEFYPLLCSIHRSLSTYLTIAVVVPKPNRQLPINCTSVNKLIICRCKKPCSVAVNKHHLLLSSCQQTVQLTPVPKPIQLKQTISPNTAFTRPINV